MSTRMLRLCSVLCILMSAGCGAFMNRDMPPTVSIVRPADGATVATGREFEVQSVASDDTGVVRVDLYVNNELIQTDTPPEEIAQRSYSLVQRWVPPAPGTVLVKVFAYDERGQSSSPAAIEVDAVGPALVADPATPNLSPTSSPVPSPTATVPTVITPTPSPTPTPEQVITGNVTVQRLNVRAGPSTTVDVLTTLDAGDTLQALARNDDGEWVQVQLSDDTVGWVAATFVSWEDDITTLPVAEDAGE